MKKCKYCQNEIDPKLKVCPICKRKQGGFPTWAKILIGIFIAIIVLSAIGNADDETPSKTSSSKGDTEQIYNIGDTIAFKNYEVTIDAVTTQSEVGGEYFKTTPSDGGIFVCVDLKYKNTSDKPISSFSTPTIRLVDSNGTKYSEDIEASSYYATEKDPDRKILSDLNPGITVSDNEVYEISKDAYETGEWYLVIDGRVKIKVK